MQVNQRNVFVILGSALLLILVWLFIVVKHNDQRQSVTDEQQLRILVSTEPESLDPHQATAEPAITIIRELFEGLVGCHPDGLEVVPGVAQSWSLDDAETTYTFNLRKDAKWSDGRLMTAADFKRAWLRILNPETAASYAYLLYPIEGAEVYNSSDGAEELAKQVGIRVMDAHTLQIRLSNPTEYFLSLLCLTPFSPLRTDIIAAKGDAWTKPENIVSNGPFVLKERVPLKVTRLVKNPHYWDTSKVKLEEIVVYPVENIETAFNMYESGKVDMNATTLPTQRIPTLQQRPDFYSTDYLATYFYRLNTTKEPFDNVLVRQAFNISFKKNQLVERVVGLGRSPAYSFTPQGIHNYRPPTSNDYNPAEAKKLLVRAGYCVKGLSEEDCKVFPKIEIIFSNRSIHRNIAEAMQNMWKEGLGIDNVELSIVDWKVQMQRTRAKNYDVSVDSWIADYVDPSTFLEVWLSTGGNNRTGWANEQYDQLVHLASIETDEIRRNQFFYEAESILLKELPLIPIYHFTSLMLMRPYVKGVYDNLMAWRPLKYARIERK